MSALDLQAEPTATLGPDGEVELEGSGVPLPLLDGDAWLSVGLDSVKDIGLGPTPGVGPPVGGELVWMNLHVDFVLFHLLRCLGSKYLRAPARGAHPMRGKARADMGESDVFPIELLRWGWGGGD